METTEKRKAGRPSVDDKVIERRFYCRKSLSERYTNDQIVERLSSNIVQGEIDSVQDKTHNKTQDKIGFVQDEMPDKVDIVQDEKDMERLRLELDAARVRIDYLENSSVAAAYDLPDKLTASELAMINLVINKRRKTGSHTQTFDNRIMSVCKQPF